MKIITPLLLIIIFGCAEHGKLNPLAPKELIKIKLDKMESKSITADLKFDDCNSKISLSGPNWLGITTNNYSYPALNVHEDSVYKSCIGKMTIDNETFQIGGIFPGSPRIGMFLLSTPEKYSWHECAETKKLNRIQINLSNCIELIDQSEPLYIVLKRGGGK